MERGRSGFTRGFTCPVLLGIPLGPFGISDTGLSPSMEPFSIGFSYPSVPTSRSRYPDGQVRRFGLFPFRSPLQGEFLFLRVLRCFTSPGWRRSPILFGLRQRGIAPAGFSHSEISGSKRVCRSPKLIAACRVLRRLLMPRHPSCALLSLTKNGLANHEYSLILGEEYVTLHFSSM